MDSAPTVRMNGEAAAALPSAGSSAGAAGDGFSDESEEEDWDKPSDDDGAAAGGTRLRCRRGWTKACFTLGKIKIVSMLVCCGAAGDCQVRCLLYGTLLFCAKSMFAC